MQETFHQYHLIKTLAKKYSHLTYLASPVNDPEHHLILIAFDPSLSFAFPRECESLLQKAQSIKNLQHPHLLPILDMGIEEEQPFVVRDYLPSGSLRNHLKRLSPRRLELRKALSIVLQVGEALAYAHEQNIFHSNIKPENILFDANGQALLTDFTLTTNTDTMLRDQTSEEYAFCYTAPEQFAGTCDAHSDQYALGCLTYELITGKPPFVAQTLSSIMEQHTNMQPVPLSERVPDLSPFLEAAVLKSLSKEPSERFFDFLLFLEVIRSALDQQPRFPFSRSVTSHKWKSASHRTRPPKGRTFLPSPHQLATTASASSQAPETLTISAHGESDSADPVNASLATADAPMPGQIDTENVFDDGWIAHLFTEHEKNELSTVFPDSPVHEQHNIAADEMALPLSKRADRSLFLTKLSQYDKRKLRVVALFGLATIIFMIAVSGAYTILLPSKPNTPDTPPHSTRVTSHILVPMITSLAGTSLATQSSPTPTAQSTPQASMAPQVVPTSQAISTPTPATLQTTTIDDSVQGTGINQFNYVGSGWNHCTSGCGTGSSNPYENSMSLDTTAGDYVTVSFTGVQIKFYSQLSVKYQGNEIITIDGGSQTTVSSHSTTNEGDYLLWTSPTLPAGTHTFEVSVPHGSNTNDCVVDRVDILS